MYRYVDQPVESLCNAGRFLLWAMRGWAHAVARATCPPVALHRGFSGMGVLTVLPDFHIAMALLNRDGLEPMALAPMGFPLIAEHEAVLLDIWRDLALGDLDHMRSTLELLVDEDSVAPISRAVTAVAARLITAGIDLSGLSTEPLKEMK